MISTRILAVLFAFAPLGATADALPRIIWASDPVQAGDAVLVRGDGLATGAVQVMSADRSWREVAVLQRTAQTMKFVLPADQAAGPVAFRIGGGEPRWLNRPATWWLQGDQVKTATPGGWVRVFGLNLAPFAATTPAPVTIPVQLVDAAGRQRDLAARAVDGCSLDIALPADLAPGSWRLRLADDAAGPCELGSIAVAPAEAWPTTTVDAVAKGAVPAEPNGLSYYTGMAAPEQVDSTAAIQAALDEVGKAGGGVVTIPRGVYVLTASLTIPPRTVLRGAGRGQTVLSWVEDLNPRARKERKVPWGALHYETIPDPKKEPYPYLIRGEGHFTVENLAIYAVDALSGIQSELPQRSPLAGHVTIRQVVVRIDRQVNVGEGNRRHYSDFEEVSARRAKNQPRLGALTISGDNMVVEDCDLYNSNYVVILNNVSGIFRRNRIAAVPLHWTLLARSANRVIFEDNVCANGGIVLNSVHDAVSLDLKVRYPSISSQEIYFARNRVADCYREDRDGGFVSDFHAPVGIYSGPALRSEGAVAELGGDLQTATDPVKWLGATFSVLEGAGAGQTAQVTAFDGRRITLDAPLTVALDGTSFVTISKAVRRVLVLDNEMSDSGNAVSFWDGGVDLLAARNRSIRAGSFSVTSLCHSAQILPSLRAQFIGNTVEDGMNWGSAYIFPRGTIVGSFTYTPLYFEGEIQKMQKKPVTAPDYHGPMAIDQVYRRNTIASSGRFFVGGNVSNVLFDRGSVSHAEAAVEIRKAGGRWDETVVGGPRDVLVRLPTMRDVTKPVMGDAQDSALIVDGQ